ncbi:MAG: 3-phosphoshikimate 1-carboxyvinyltransferase [Actinobacteria bacterium]|nr:3-phosphoshikimate 1-carboxyvinyltransferase [Actinomycetota bacterium]
MDTWPAPTATQPVDATVRVPGSKSATNRALVLASLADGPSTVSGALLARDTSLMADALRALGIALERGSEGDGNATWRVTPGALVAAGTIDVGLAGTVMRFVPPVAALANGATAFDGDPRARERPLGPMISALRDLGVTCTDSNGFLPLRVEGTGHVPGGAVDIDASASSQFVSGLLLSAARFDAGLTLTHTERSLPSQPHIAMTLHMLAEHGVHVDFDAERMTWTLAPGPIAAIDRTIEPDLSNAGPFLAAAVATAGTITVPGWPHHTTQAGDHLRGLLAEMGAQVRLGDDGLTVTGPGSIRGIDVDLFDVGELTPIIAALCALAASPSRMRGIAHLRGHETDRLAAIVETINALGGRAYETGDGITVEPAALHGATVSSYDDHRMATAAAVIGLVVPDVHVIGMAATTKTLPDFPGMWHGMLAGD